MAFRKRNVGISRGPSSAEPKISPSVPKPVSRPGIRPSPIDGRPTTSTGTPTLDGILAGHAGLALGNSILIEESGTTDYSGALLRYYAAEGVVQRHNVHVVGLDEQWGRELPGLVGTADTDPEGGERVEKKERMKIAWRYERLGEFGHGVSGRRAPPPLVNQSTPGSDQGRSLSSNQQASPFAPVLQSLLRGLTSSPAGTIHRLVIPTLLSPVLYPPLACQPNHLIQFMHSLRSLLRQYPTQLTALISLPLELYPRTSGLVRWMELLSDGVLELTPFPHLMSASSASAASGAATVQEDQPQGMLRIHRLPIFHEKGGGGGGSSGLGDDLAFTVSRKKFTIKPFSLPPVEGDTEAQQGALEGSTGKATIADFDF